MPIWEFELCHLGEEMYQACSRAVPSRGVELCQAGGMVVDVELKAAPWQAVVDICQAGVDL